MDRVRVVVLHWLNNVNEVDFRGFPVMIMLMVLMFGFRDKVVITDPMIFRFMLLFRCLCLRIDPEVLVKVMGWVLFIPMNRVVFLMIIMVLIVVIMLILVPMLFMSD